LLAAYVQAIGKRSARPVSGVLMEYLRKPTSRLLRCPSVATVYDPKRRSPILVAGNSFEQIYPFSYGLSDPSGIEGDQPYSHHGMTSVIRSDNRGWQGWNKESPDPHWLYYFKANSVAAPSEKIVF